MYLCFYFSQTWLNTINYIYVIHFTVFYSMLTDIPMVNYSLLDAVSPNSLIFLIVAVILWKIIVSLHLNPQEDYVLLFRSSQTSILIELLSKRFFDFSLKFLKLPMRVHLKKIRYIETSLSIFKNSISPNHSLHSLIMEPLFLKFINLVN